MWFFLLGPCWSWWGPWNAWRVRGQGTWCHHKNFYFHVTNCKLPIVYHFHEALLQAFCRPFWLWFMVMFVARWHLHCVPLQGDRGFDGLPGLPGEKGHRVSCHKNHLFLQSKAAFLSLPVSDSTEDTFLWKLTIERNNEPQCTTAYRLARETTPVVFNKNSKKRVWSQKHYNMTLQQNPLWFLRLAERFGIIWQKMETFMH